MTSQKTKQEHDFDFMPFWKKEEQCYEEAKVEGKDWHGKKTTITWPRDKPIEQVMYDLWLSKVKDPDTGEFYHKRDKDGNIIKGTGPRHIVRQIVRIRANGGSEFLYSNGFLLGYNVLGDAVHETCSNPETWQRTGFMYNREYDPKSMSVKAKIVGPNSDETVYEMQFNEKNLKTLFDKRITPEDLKELAQKRMLTLFFCVKDENNNVVREVKDATGIVQKSMDLFMKGFDYLMNSDYITPQQKAEARQQAIDMGLLPREAQGQGQPSQDPGTKPPTGTYS